jgi:ankyrin repeat protein
MASYRRALPARPDLEQQRKLAKELLDDYRAGEREAVARIRSELPDKQTIALADAQFVLAREYGFANWAALRQQIASVSDERRPLEERFKEAVRTHDVAALRRLIPHRAELESIVNAPIFDFDSPALVSVAGSGDVDLIDALLQLGADPNRRSDWWAGGFHPLHSAPPGPAAERLLTAGAVADACAAAQIDRPDLLRRLLAEDPARVHERGGDGQTPLHFARSREVVDILLEAGAEIDARDVDHRATPAQWMIGGDNGNSRRSLAKYLVDRGATAEIFLAAALGLTSRVVRMLERDPTLLSLRTGQGEYGEKLPSSYHIYTWTIGQNITPMQTAAHFGQRETLEAMRAFASPAQRLLLACHNGDREAARGILREQPDIVQRLTGDDRRALTDEAWIGNEKAVDLMMELGFDPGVRSVGGATGGTALHCAAWKGSVASVAAILRYPTGRALLETRDTSHNGTPLGWCCHGSLNCGSPGANHAEVARLLVAAGASIPSPVADIQASESVRKVLRG